MNRSWPFLVLLIMMMACDKKKDNDCDWNEITTFFFSHNKKVDTATHPFTGVLYANSVAGPDMVFEYKKSVSPCGYVLDAGYIDRLIFQVPAGSNSFDYADSTTLANANTYFMRSCYCANVTSEHVTGRIKGTKLTSNTWSLQIDVKASRMGEQRLTTDMVATLQ